VREGELILVVVDMDEAPRRNTVIGQRVARGTHARAREMRTAPTVHEQLLWQRLRRNALGGFHFRRQQVTDGFIVDFYCHAAGLVVEVDGPIHQQKVSYDEERDAVLKARGLRLLRVNNELVESDLPAVLVAILRELRRT
jgi:very-short-patch-repair endonuclease